MAIEKVETAEEAAKVFSEHKYLNVKDWRPYGFGEWVMGVIDLTNRWYNRLEFCAIANTLNGYYSSLEVKCGRPKAKPKAGVLSVSI